MLSHRPDLIHRSWVPAECEGILWKAPSSLARPALEILLRPRLGGAGLGDQRPVTALEARAARRLNLESGGGAQRPALSSVQPAARVPHYIVT